MKEAYYFRHDTTADQDEKITNLLMALGNAGYGLYWRIIERLSRSNNYQRKKDYGLLGYELRTETSLLKRVIEEFGLFDFTEDGKFFYSARLTRDLEAVNELSAKRSEAGRKGRAIQLKTSNLEKDVKSDSEQMPSKRQANARQTPGSNIREDNIREKYIEKEIIKEKAAKRTAFVPPTLTEVQEYISEKGFAIDAEHFIDFYTSKGWMVGANKMKDWRAAVRTWKKRSNDNTHTATNASRRGHVLTNGQDKDWDAGF